MYYLCINIIGVYVRKKNDGWYFSNRTVVYALVYAWHVWLGILPEKPEPEPEKSEPEKPEHNFGLQATVPEIIIGNSGIKPRYPNYPKNPNKIPTQIFSVSLAHHLPSPAHHHLSASNPSTPASTPNAHTPAPVTLTVLRPCP